jgi:hypothetical protein
MRYPSGASVESVEQPWHRVEVIDGTPIDQHDDLDRIWLGKPGAAKAAAQADQLVRSDTREDCELIKRVVTGEGFHVELTALSARYVGRGIPGGTVEEVLRGMMLSHPEGARDERWLDRYYSIDGLVASAVEKYARKIDEGQRALARLAGRLIHERQPSEQVRSAVQAEAARLGIDGEKAERIISPGPPSGKSQSGHPTMLHADPLQTLDEMNNREKEAGGEDEAPKSPLWIDAADWNEADIPRRPWVAPGYALRGAVTLVCGPPSTLKSSIMLSWASAIALHHEFGAFHPTSADKVVVYNVEDDQNEQRRRLSAVLRQLGAKPPDIKDKVIRVGPHTIGTLLERGEKDGKIRFTPAMDDLDSLVAALRPAAMIVDPLAELHNVEENDNTALRMVIATFRELAIKYTMAVIVLHHTRKGSAASPGDSDIARGASAIVGAVRIAVTLTTMSEADAQEFGLPTDITARNNYVRMDDAKSNYAPLRAAQWFEKVPYTLDNGETVPAAVPWTPPEAKVASDADLAALKTAIERGCPGGEPWSKKLSREPRSVRALLEQYKFHGHAAQREALAKLEAECGLMTARYRNPRNRAPTFGLRIGAKPVADWIEPDEDPDDQDAE